MKTSNNKKRSVFLVLLLLLFIVAVPSAMADITGSYHDFSGNSWSGGQICVVCHTPHSGDTSGDAPLWNHETTTATFTMYSSSTMNATASSPGGRSKLCLSCHDGTVALDSFGGNTGTNIISRSEEHTSELQSH